jgi:hypothetical protein
MSLKNLQLAAVAVVNFKRQPAFIADALKKILIKYCLVQFF